MAHQPARLAKISRSGFTKRLSRNREEKDILTGTFDPTPVCTGKCTHNQLCTNADATHKEKKT